MDARMGYLPVKGVLRDDDLEGSQAFEYGAYCAAALKVEVVVGPAHFRKVFCEALMGHDPRPFLHCSVVLLLRGSETIFRDAADLQRLPRQHPKFLLSEPRELPDWVLQTLSNTLCKKSASAERAPSDSRRLPSQD
jgi:hypothetical protein